MCVGCKTRERIIHRTHERLEAAFRELDRAYDAVRAVLVDTSGPTPAVRKTEQTSDKPQPQPTRRKRGEQLQLAL